MGSLKYYNSDETLSTLAKGYVSLRVTYRADPRHAT